jgi:serine/threonine protein kinase
MAKIIAIGQPVNDSERKAILYLRDNLPDTYTIFHNFELLQGKETFEIDLAIIAPHSIFVVDIKGITGLIDIYGSAWYPEGRAAIHSPLAKLRQHAKVLKFAISDANPTITDLRNLYVHAVVLMTAPDAHVETHGSPDGDNITYLNQTCLTYFKGKSHIPARFLQDIRPLHRYIESTIQGKARPKSAPTCYGNWEITDKLSETDRYSEYRAKHILLGKRGGIARLRVYQVDTYQDKATRIAQRNLISNAFRSVAHMQPHPNILAVREFFSNEAEDRLILVTEDIPSQPLRQHIRKPQLALTFDQKLNVIKDILTALNHAHKCEVIHRNLTPDAILVDARGQARLTAFDYARVTKNRSSTIAEAIVDDLDYSYHAPECYRDPTQASIASDLFSAGLVFYELLTGQTAFENTSQLFDRDAIFPEKASTRKPELPEKIDNWLQTLCAFDPEDRFASAAVALNELFALIAPRGEIKTEKTLMENKNNPDISLSDLPKDYRLGDRFIVQQRLGKPGGFGVAYKVMDTLGDVVRAMKLITRDRRSVYERLRREYKTLLQVPEHPNVVKAIWADKFPDETPYIVFEYVEGLNVEQLLEQEALSLEDAKTIAQQTAAGLAHLHENGVYHLDIKPSNLLWTDSGVRIIDFNVAVSENDESAIGGGTRRYIPPDFDFTTEPDAAEKIDRDLYALGITFYECVTGCYPFEEQTPPIGKTARNPCENKGCEDLSEELVALLLQAIAPRKTDRFRSAKDFEKAIAALPRLKNIPEAIALTETSILPATAKPNFNPFVSQFLTLYSQSQRTNAGTRGLDSIAKATYIETLLDRELLPALLAGEFKLAIISGNAGDGKTAFIQKLEQHAQERGVTLERGLNGSVFSFQGHTFRTNYDGSQDEGEKVNSEVLLEFFAPFQGENEQSWNPPEICIIAINEGRLVDFLQEYCDRFPKLSTLVREGLKGLNSVKDIAIINLNLRSVVADETEDDSIFDRLIRRFTQPQFWSACQTCDIKDKCYIYHNAQTFMDGKAGSKAIARLKMLYAITHLRSRLHITLRDLRSALAFMLVGTKDCDEVHELYRSSAPEARQQILDGFYFNAWMGGKQGSSDRLISLLKEIDIGEVNNPNLDRTFAFLQPNAKEMGRFAFGQRDRYDDYLFERELGILAQDYSTPVDLYHLHAYKNYVAMLRRRYYFECRDEEWKDMLPYRQRSAESFLALVKNRQNFDEEVKQILFAINQGEGLRNPARLGNNLALRVRQVEKGTIRSYRLFDGQKFWLSSALIAPDLGRFLEYLPQSLALYYNSNSGYRAELSINLDIYEMLKRLNQGYRPSIEEQQGFYRSLTVFKNLLASAPYQEVLLTETGQEFYRIRRDRDGKLKLELVGELVS